MTIEKRVKDAEKAVGLVEDADKIVILEIFYVDYLKDPSGHIKYLADVIDWNRVTDGRRKYTREEVAEYARCHGLKLETEHDDEELTPGELDKLLNPELEPDAE
jgi:hypothetical protein